MIGGDPAELLAHARELDFDRAGARGELIELLRGPLELTLGDGDRHDSERLDLRLGSLRLDAGRRERAEVGVDGRELGPNVRGFGNERLDNAFIGNRRELALEPAGAFRHEIHESAAAFPQRLGTGEHVGDVVVARHGERVLGVEYLGIERAQLNPYVLLAFGEVAARLHALGLAAAQLLDLASGKVQTDRVELGHETVVTASGVGLPLERPQLPPYFAQQIGEPQKVALGRVEPTLCLLLAFTELEDPGRLLDDRPAILGAGVEYRIELALPDDHVLLAADASVGEKVLDVEQPARLRAEHPGHRVDDVRLPRPIRADDDAHTGLELERGLVREGLEALQRQRLEEQLSPLSECRW